MKDIEESYQQAKVKEFYTKIRTGKDGFKARINNIGDDDGKIILGEDKILQSGKHYFNKLLNNTISAPADDGRNSLTAETRLKMSPLYNSVCTSPETKFDRAINLGF